MEKNQIFTEILQNNDMIVFVDTNFFIVPENINKDQFNEYWIEEIRKLLPNLCIHESVYDELVTTDLKRIGSSFKVCYTEDLSKNQFDKFKFAVQLLKSVLGFGFTTKNKNLGEIETLAYMFVQDNHGIITRDKDVINNLSNTKLHILFKGEYGVIHFYELLYLLKCQSTVPKSFLKALFKRYYPKGVKDTTQTSIYIKDFGELMGIMENLYEESVSKVNSNTYNFKDTDKMNLV